MMKRAREAEDGEGATGYSEDVAIIPVSKIMNIDTGDIAPEANKTAIQCSLPGHARGTTFDSYAEYEKHYAHTHSNRCLECRKNFPSSYIMSLHIQEHHDALMEMKREKGDSTYACFVEVCEEAFQSFQEREQHLIRDHTYPQNYYFAVTKFGINNNRQSMLVETRKNDSQDTSKAKVSRSKGRKAKGRATQAAAQSDDNGESKDVQMVDAERSSDGHQEGAQGVSLVEKPREAEDTVVTARDKATPPGARPSEQQEQQRSAVADTEMDDLSGAMSSLKFVPRAIRLGPKQKPRR